MISNQILQNTIDGLKNISKFNFGIMDAAGKEVASTSKMSGYSQAAAEFAKNEAASQEMRECLFFKVFDEGAVEYILIVVGSWDAAYLAGQMAAFQIQGLVTAYKERLDKDNFVKNLLLDNLLLVDIYSRAKKLHINTEALRVAFIVEAYPTTEINVLDRIRTNFGQTGTDIVTAVDEDDIIVVCEMKEDDMAEVAKKAAVIDKFLTDSGIESHRVAYGTIVDEIREVSRSYKEAKMALDVGKIFFEERKVMAYPELGIGRLIYQLPIPLCKMFMREIVGSSSFDDIDEETLDTILKFFENSLNVSETSRQQFIHRNTLVYRLDKIQKATGLDLREFDDAITFKIAMMVDKYMKYMEAYEY